MLIQTPELVQFLRATRLFGNLSDAILSEIALRLELIEVPEGGIVMRKDEPGDSLYLIWRGQLKIVAYDEGDHEVVLNHLAVGEGVGEIALLTGERRTATVCATLPTELLRFSSDQFEQLRQQHPEFIQALSQAIIQRLQQAYLSTALRVSKVLDQLEESVLRDLEAELELVLLSSGQTLVRQGEESDALYLVINGRLRVVLEAEGGEEKVLVELGRGQTVGEVALFTGEPRTATVYALRDCLLARLSQAGFDRLLRKHPEAILHRFATVVINRLVGQIKGTLPPESNYTAFAVVPVNAEVPIATFTEQFVGVLSAQGKTLHLNAARLEDALLKKGAAQTPANDPANFNIVRWLSEQEVYYQYIVYEVDPTLSAWTQRCLGQADQILLVADAGLPPKLGASAQAALTPSDGRGPAQSSLVLLQSPSAERPTGAGRWLDLCPVKHHYHVRQDRLDDFARLARLLTGCGIGVVLSGGGARGFAHIGALRALREAGIPIDLIGGTSAGGLVACQYAMGWDQATIMEKNRQAIRHKFDYTFPITSLMAGAEMTVVVKEMFGDTQMEDMWLPCFCVTTDLSKAQRVVHERGPVWKYTRATTSIPGILPPVMDQGDMLVDGGVLDNLPADVMRLRIGEGIIFAVDASEAMGSGSYPDAPFESSLSGWQVLLSRVNPLARPLPVPTLGDIMMRLAVISNAQAIRTTRELADFYIPLAVGKYGMLEFSALETIAELGYQSARALIATWQQEGRLNQLRQDHQPLQPNKRETL